MKAYCDRCYTDVTQNSELEEYWFTDINQDQDICAKCVTELKVSGCLNEESGEYSENVEDV